MHTDVKIYTGNTVDIAKAIVNVISRYDKQVICNADGVSWSEVRHVVRQLVWCSWNIQNSLDSCLLLGISY